MKVAGETVAGAELAGERIVTFDACVIGTGAGGAPVAAELAAAGLRVAMLEEGAWHDADDFSARPRDMAPRLYRDGGQSVTIGDPPIVLPTGRGVGGTTLINSGTCFRTPAHVLERWREDDGLSALTEEELAPVFDDVEATIGVAEVPADLAGENAAIVRRGAERLGLSGGYLRRNARGCVGSGVCAFGCPAGAKQHTGVTFVPRAWEHGAVLFTDATVRDLVRRGDRVTEVVASTSAGGTLRVRADVFVVACGTIGTPLLLRRNGLGTASGQLGRNLSIHPASAVRARMDHEVRMWEGVPQSYYVDAYAADGIMLEGIAAPPDQAAMATPRAGAVLRDLMLDVRRSASFGVMVTDEGRGAVHSVLGRPVLRYDLHPGDAARFQRGFAHLAEIFFAAGAREVIVPVSGLPALRDRDVEPLLRARVRPRDLKLMAFHPLGTARAGADPERSVVDGDLRVHGLANLFVADGSVVPSSPGVNPQLTIMALATRAARLIAARG
ncbi:MAG: GMC family oxidoreductase [Solirubrobacteraceae bacterium]|nr:GMC family oxidoreductase [Solirubrobacteraceae bacterium]